MGRSSWSPSRGTDLDKMRFFALLACFGIVGVAAAVYPVMTSLDPVPMAVNTIIAILYPDADSSGPDIPIGQCFRYTSQMRRKGTNYCFSREPFRTCDGMCRAVSYRNKLLTYTCLAGDDRRVASIIAQIEGGAPVASVAGLPVAFTATASEATNCVLKPHN